MKSTLAALFMLAAAAGFAASLVAHLDALFSLGLFAAPPMYLHAGIFLVWLPTILAARALSAEVPQRQRWQATLRGCPAGMRYALYALLAYAVLNFALFALHRPRGEQAQVRGFSGHWLVFYYAAFAVLYSYRHVQRHDPLRRCRNGHALPPLARFCPECGAPREAPNAEEP